MLVVSSALSVVSPPITEETASSVQVARVLHEMQEHGLGVGGGNPVVMGAEKGPSFVGETFEQKKTPVKLGLGDTRYSCNISNMM